MVRRVARCRNNHAVARFGIRNLSMNILFLLLILGCAKQSMIDHAMARELMTGNNCLEKLRTYMEEADCPQLKYTMLSEHDIMFTCHKPDQERKTFWDSYVFRISPTSMKYTEKSKKYIEQHTICIDNYQRIGAYPTSFDKNKE